MVHLAPPLIMVKDCLADQVAEGQLTLVIAHVLVITTVVRLRAVQAIRQAFRLLKGLLAGVENGMSPVVILLLQEAVAEHHPQVETRGLGLLVLAALVLLLLYLVLVLPTLAAEVVGLRL